jgi:hypothetical protein
LDKIITNHPVITDYTDNHKPTTEPGHPSTQLFLSSKPFTITGYFSRDYIHYGFGKEQSEEAFLLATYSLELEELDRQYLQGEAVEGATIGSCSYLHTSARMPGAMKTGEFVPLPPDPFPSQLPSDESTQAAITPLDLSVSEFKASYKAFVKRNSQFFLVDEDIDGAFQAAQTEEDIRRGSKIFTAGIWAALQAVQKRKNLAEGSWTTKLGNVLTKLYPVARLSLDLLASIGDVLSKLMYTDEDRQDLSHH